MAEIDPDAVVDGPQYIYSTFVSEEAIRADERRKLADLLEQHGETLTSYTGDDSSTLKLVIHLLRLGRD